MEYTHSGLFIRFKVLMTVSGTTPGLVRTVIGPIMMFDIKFLEHWIHLFDRFICPRGPNHYS